jgi:uncharacterized secreted protein with C-terminal beta-propeller domain
MRRRSISTRLWLTTATAATAIGAVACSSGPGPGAGTAQGVAHPDLSLVSALQQFSSCDDVLANFKAEATKRVTEYGLPNRSAVAVPEMAPAATGSPVPLAAYDQAAPSSGAAGSGAAVAPSPPSTPTAHSDTNVQEAGVDEPDIAKTDGNHLYTIENNTLYVFTLDNGVPTQTGSLPVGSTGAEQLLVSGDKLLVLTKRPASSTRGPIGIEDPMMPNATPAGTGSDLTEVDVSDPAHPKATSQISLDGSVVDARLANGTARVVISSTPTPLSFVQPTSYTAAGRQQAIDANRRIIASSTIDDWLPTYTIAGSTEHRQLVDCADVSHPKQFSGFGTVTVLSVKVGDGIDPRQSVAVQADADHVYATANHLYVSTNQEPAPTNDDDVTSETAPATVPGTNWSRGGAIDCDPACPPPPSNNPVPNGPPLSTSTTTTPPPDPGYSASIHEFDISGTGPATYLASGSVKGHILDDFAMSEDSGYLRVATTDGPPWIEEGSDQSYVSVLHEDHGGLQQVGQVGGLGQGERIQSVRFIGSVGYVVTFRQSDPLYTVDIRDPKNPKVAGELSLLGYSAYLHPVGDGRLLGIGQDATAHGSTLGTKVSLFDVSDPGQPKLVQSETLPGTTSEVEQDYHAFLWWAPSHLALIPVQGYDGPMPGPLTSSAEQSSFVGVLGFTVDDGGIRDAGRIDNPVATPTPTPTPPTPTPSDGGSPDCAPGFRCIDGRSIPLPPSTTLPPQVPTTITNGDDPTTSATSTTKPTVPSTPGTAVPGDGSTTSTTATTAAPTTTPSSTSSTDTSTSTSPSTSTSTTEAPSTTTTLRPVPAIPSTGGAPIDRAVVVGDHVLTISAGGILVSDLATLAPITWVPFA